MSNGKQQQWIIKRNPEGRLPELGSDIELVECNIAEPKSGEFLVQVLATTIDPYQIMMMRMDTDWHDGHHLTWPRPVASEGVGRVIKSNNNKWKVGSLVRGRFPWSTHVVTDGTACVAIPDGVKATLTLGALGMPGATAYFGLLDVAQPKEGETLLVSAAAGAVGSLVGQIGKLKGLRVIGVAGSPDKAQFVKDLGFDAVINYKGKSVAQLVEELKAAAPKGIDVYFDATGGDITKAALQVLNSCARISVCGQISTYENQSATEVPLGLCLMKQLEVKGFIVNRWKDWSPAFDDMRKWIVEGKLQATEDIDTGINNCYDSFMQLFNQGSAGKKSNVGKKIVILHDDPALHTKTTAAAETCGSVRTCEPCHTEKVTRVATTTHG